MIWKTTLHYARFWLVLALVSGQLTEEQREQILDLHNQYRSMVIPEAADMQRMMWNDALSLVAEDYAAQCIWEHNPEVIDDFGENLFLTTGKLSVSKSIASWFDEHKNYDYDTNTCRAGMCGHYTQLMWASSRNVGCASHFCHTVQKIHYRNATIVVCNYEPAGNVNEEQPYEEGASCSKCPMGMDDCIRNACAEIKSTTEEPLTRWTTDTLTTDTWTTDTWTKDTLTSDATNVPSSGFIDLAGSSLLLAALILSFLF